MWFINENVAEAAIVARNNFRDEVWGTSMSDKWQYQVRVTLKEEQAAQARRDVNDASLAPLGEILTKHNAILKCQYEAFADYCEAAEKEGTDQYPLYQWTKDTIDDPQKKAKYLKSFTFYVDGNEIYDKNKADPLEADLQPLAANGLIGSLTKHDTNPANNPQPPKKYRQ